MKFSEKSRACVVGALLLGSVASAAALSLGRLRGATIIGRTLDLSLTAQLEGTDGLASLCVEADVYFGDNQLPPGRVRVSTEATGQPGEAVVRVRTTSAVDEPVVTVYLREGCSLKNTRKYVVLADVLADNVAPVPLVAARQSVQAAIPAPAAQAVESVSAPVPAKRRREVRRSEALAAPDTASPPPMPGLDRSASSLEKKRAPESSRQKGRAHLKLETLDLAAERVPTLRASGELLSVPLDDQQRQAAAALWRAINAQPEDILRDSQRLKALEGDVASLLAQNRKAQQTVADLTSELEQARKERYANWLVYALGAALAAVAAGLVWIWRRAGQGVAASPSRPWWGKSDEAEFEDSGLPGTILDDMPAGAGHMATNPKGKARPPAITEVDVDLDVDESLFASLKHGSVLPATSHFELPEHDRHPEFSSSLPGMPRSVNAEELFDVQQQADFFISLGQFDQAVEVLRHHITDNVETSALAYLDLFDLYHRLGRKDEYELLRKDFNRVFNAQVPTFDEYTTDNKGLDSYAAAFSRIESLWPTPKVLDLIEESIFRKPDSGGKAFNLTAYRELLLLYSIAKEIVDRPSGLMDFELSESSKPLAPDSSGFEHRLTEFSSTNIQPLSADASGNTSLPVLPGQDFDPTLPPASSKLGLDIDLSGTLDEKPMRKSRDRSAADAPTVPVSVEIPEATSNLIEFDASVLDSTQPPPWPKDK